MGCPSRPSHGHRTSIARPSHSTEIAGCIEASYETLRLNDAQKLMKFDGFGEMQTFISEEKPDWQVRADQIYFELEGHKKAEVPSLQLIKQVG